MVVPNLAVRGNKIRTTTVCSEFCNYTNSMNADIDLDIGRKTFASGLLPELIAMLRHSRPGGFIAIVGDEEGIGLEKVNRKNRCMATISVAERERPIFQFSDRRNRASSYCDDLVIQPRFSVAHGDRMAGIGAPLLGLQVGKVSIPGNINMRHDHARPGRERENLYLVALK